LIDLTINREALEKNISLAKERGIRIPAFKQLKNPESIPEEVKEKLKGIGLWDINPLNLYRVNWKNEPVESGGLFGSPNVIELPKSLTGVDAHISALVGKWFPTGCHKVGAAFGCLVPRLVTGQFDASSHKAVWPSTGNYCRGGAFNSALLGVHSIAILPKGMSRERFSWLEKVASEIIATPGTESNVKEIFDKTWELRNTRKDCMIFNQFEEMGNHLWHYEITGNAIVEAFNSVKGENGNLAACCFTSGSAGTIGSGDYVKEVFPSAKIAVGEALQCPTILNNGFGSHGIEGIGDKHIPWIHNARNTDLAIAIDDEDCLGILRLFNTTEGKKYLLEEAGVPKETVDSLSLIGISGIANILCAIKTAKY
jgi:cysteine synthase